jgi:hypothetical protein
MNERIRQLAVMANPSSKEIYEADNWQYNCAAWDSNNLTKFAELIVQECINREELLGAIARGWCSEKNSHKTMDSDLALAIFDEVEQQIKQKFGVE